MIEVTWHSRVLQDLVRRDHESCHGALERDLWAGEGLGRRERTGNSLLNQAKIQSSEERCSSAGPAPGAVESSGAASSRVGPVGAGGARACAAVTRLEEQELTSSILAGDVREDGSTNLGVSFFIWKRESAT